MSQNGASRSAERTDWVNACLSSAFPMGFAGMFAWAVAHQITTRDWDGTLLMIAILEIPALILRSIAAKVSDQQQVSAGRRAGIFLAIGFCVMVYLFGDAIFEPSKRPFAISIGLMLSSGTLNLFLASHESDLERSRKTAIAADCRELVVMLYMAAFYTLMLGLIALIAWLFLDHRMPEIRGNDELLLLARETGFALMAAYFFGQACVCAFAYSATFARTRQRLLQGRWVRRFERGGR